MPVQNSYFDTVSASNPTIWFRFNETSGTPSNSGSVSCTLTSFGTPTLNADSSVDGRAISLNGSSYFTLSKLPSFSLFDDRTFTIEFWLKVSTSDTASSGKKTILSIIKPNSNEKIVFWVGGTDVNSTPQGVLNVDYNFGSGYGSGRTQYNFGNRIDNNTWRHIVLSVRSGGSGAELQFHMNGSTSANSIGLLAPSTLNWDNTAEIIIGNSSSATYGLYKGNIDELAFYGTPITNIAINNNYVAGSAVYFTDIPGTASALMVQPQLVRSTTITADPMTASSTSGNHAASNFNKDPLLTTYMLSLPLEQYCTFSPYKQYTNPKSGGQPGISYVGVAENYITGGVQMSGAAEITGSGADGYISFGQPFVDTELTDGNFVLGMWIKSPTYTTQQSNIFATYNNNGHGYRADYVGGYPWFRIDNSGGTHEIQINSGAKIDDNKWHLVVFKVYNGNLEIWIDNVLRGSTTYNGQAPSGMGAFQFAGNNLGPKTVKYQISQLFVGTTANITSGILSNIYNYGNSELHAIAEMRNGIPKFNSAYNDKVESLGPILDFRAEEGSGTTIMTDVVNGVELNLFGNSTAVTSGIPALNNKCFSSSDGSTYFKGVYGAPSGTFSNGGKQSVSFIFKGTTINTGDWNRLVSTGLEGSNGLNVVLNSSGNIQVFSLNFTYGYGEVVSSGNYADNEWHHVVATYANGSIKIYVDGQLKGSGTINMPLTDTLTLGFGGIYFDGYGFFNYPYNRTLTIDEFAVYPYDLSAQQAFELYQALTISMATTATANSVMPTIQTGTGTINAASPMTASAEQIHPAIPAYPMIAFATILMPNYGTTIVIDSNYGHTSATANAVFHMPQYSIGEFNAADHMDASALMVHPTSISGGQISVSPAIANNARLVMPGIVTVKGRRVFADPFLATAIIPLPPAYVQLSDDKWFATLLEGHADKAIEPIQAMLGNLPNQSSTDIIKGGFLTFFNEFNSDLTTTTQINSIQSEIPAYYFSREEEIRYDQNGILIPLDTSKNVSPARAQRGNNLTIPRMGVGYFDDYERKAVRIENIEFPFPGTSAQFSDRFYNLEFSIKTTKKDQVLAYGYKTQTYGFGRKMGVVGLSDGKIYLTEDSSQRYTSGLRNIWSLSAPHPKNFVNRAQYLLSKTNVADGNWHHVIIQYGYDDRRTQIWIDGKLDRQLGASGADGRTFYSSTPGLDGTNTVRPYILGFNSNDPLLYSDFETSGWNFYPGRFLTSQQTLVNYLAYLKYEPIKAEPMLGTVNISQNNIGQGNKSKMLLLYWWRNPIGRNQFVQTIFNPLTTGYDGNNSPWSPEDLIDDPKKPPISWEGWDVFPVGIVTPAPSDIIKINNIGNDSYIDIENGRTRYLNLQEDLDLSQFDQIMFANYPTTSEQLDEFVREESVDSYFGVKEKDNYVNFLKSLRAAVDSGMSLLVQFDQLARDLKIYDRVDRIPIFDEGISDKRAFWHTNNTDWDIANNVPIKNENGCRLAIDLQAGAYFEDRYNNMRHRVINTIPFLTDDPTYIFTDRAYYQNSDVINFGGPNRNYERFEYKNQGLQPGDEFIFGNPSNTTPFGNSRARQTSMLAIPFENVKAGKIITAQPEKYWKGDEYVDNPYKNYAHSIALQPGDVLDGRGIGGKIFVSISEVFWDKTPEYRIVDLYSDYWIDISYDLGFLGTKKASANDPDGPAESTRDELKAKGEYVSPIGISAEQYAWSTYWSRNDNFAFTQVDRGEDYSGILGLLFENSIELEKVPTSRKALTSFTRRRDQLGRFASGAGGSGQLFFQFKTGRLTETMNVFVPNLFTRAFWWLSERERPTGLVQRPEKSTASATMPNAKTVVDKIINVNATVMIANSILPQNITGTITPSTKSITLTTLPLIANATIVELGKRIFANPMNATTLAVDPGIFTYALEEIILTIANTEAVVYVRGDKIT